MKLCASRAFWLVAYPGQGHEVLFDAHTRSFAAPGAIARRGSYDDIKTAVDRVGKGKGRGVNARFAVMSADYLVDADFCNVASGLEKGIVEKNVQDSRRRIWTVAAQSALAQRRADGRITDCWAQAAELAIREKAESIRLALVDRAAASEIFKFPIEQEADGANA